MQENCFKQKKKSVNENLLHITIEMTKKQWKFDYLYCVRIEYLKWFQIKYQIGVESKWNAFLLNVR